MIVPDWLVPAYAFCYRTMSKALHQFGLHYAPEHGPMEDGRYTRWCKWCGMRDSFIKKDSVLWDRQIGLLGTQQVIRQGQCGGIAATDCKKVQ